MFVWADEGSELKVDVPVTFKGEDVCPGLKKGNCFYYTRFAVCTPNFHIGYIVPYCADDQSFKALMIVYQC